MLSCVLAKLPQRRAVSLSGVRVAGESYVTNWAALLHLKNSPPHPIFFSSSPGNCKTGLWRPIQKYSGVVGMSCGKRSVYTLTGAVLTVNANGEPLSALQESGASQTAALQTLHESVTAVAENAQTRPLSTPNAFSEAAAPQKVKDSVAAEKAQTPECVKTDEGHAATSNDTAAGMREEEEEGSKERRDSWWGRKWHSFKSEGKDFSFFYLPFYPATFIILYVAFATSALHKESILDYVLNFMGDYVDKKKMYQRIEAWDTWANLGFAFVINELLEVVRFPVVVVLYYAIKPWSTDFANWLRKAMCRFRWAKPRVVGK